MLRQVHRRPSGLLFCIYIRCSGFLGRAFGLSLEQHRVCKVLQPPLTRNGGTCAFFLLIGTVEILKCLEFFGGFDFCTQLVCQLTLLLDARKDFLLPLDKAAQVGETCLHLTQDLVLKGVGRLFAVTGDERNRVAVVEECDDGFDLLRTDGEFARNRGWNIGDAHETKPFFSIECFPLYHDFRAVQKISLILITGLLTGVFG